MFDNIYLFCMKKAWMILYEYPYKLSYAVCLLGITKTCNSVLQYPSSASLCNLSVLGIISHVHKNLALIPFVSHMSPIHTLPSCPFKVCFNITLPLRPGFPNCLFTSDFATHPCKHFCSLPYNIYPMLLGRSD